MFFFDQLVLQMKSQERNRKGREETFLRYPAEISNWFFNANNSLNIKYGYEKKKKSALLLNNEVMNSEKVFVFASDGVSVTQNFLATP